MTRTYNGFIIKPHLQWGQIHTDNKGFPILVPRRKRCP